MSTSGQVPRFNIATAEYQAFPEYGGSHAILYRSDDRRRLVGSFQESGTHTMVMEFDELIHCLAGKAEISVTDGDSFEMGPGDVCYLREGLEVTMTMSDGFHDVAVLISDTPFEI